MSTHKLSNITSKSALINLQRNFAQIIRRPLLSDDKMKKDPRSNKISLPSKRLDPHARLEIYSQQYWWRIQQSLDEDFTTVQKIIPQSIYLKVRDDYLNKFPSKSFTLRNLGNRFPKYVKTTQHISGLDQKLVYEAAIYDWARVEAFDSAENTPIESKDVLNKRFPSKKLYLQPYVQLLKFSSPVHEILKNSFIAHAEIASNVLLKKTLNAKKHKNNNTLLKIPLKSTFVAVHRFEQQVFVKDLTKIQFQLLSFFRKGVSLNSLEENLAKKSINLEDEFEDFFKHLMSLKWLSMTKG